MTNYGAKIVNSAISGLNAHQAQLAATANNIANVDTPGYARRTLNLETRVNRSGSSSLNLGNGVSIAGLSRTVDEYLQRNVRAATGSEAGAQIEKDFTERIEQLFSLTGDQRTVGSALTAFFSSVDDLSLNPASIELRTNMLERANDLVMTVSDSFESVAALQTEADQRIVTEVASMNGLLRQIAEMNALVSQREGAGNIAADERDQRERLVEQLAEKLSFTVTNVDDGSISITLDNGLVLVSGDDARLIEVTTNPSFLSGTPPPSLQGRVLNYIVFDYDQSGGTAHINLTDTIAEGEGTLGALLRVRGVQQTADTSAFDASGSLVDIASRIESISRMLLTTFNDTYLGPDEDSGTAGRQASSGDLNGNTPGVYGLFSFNTTGARDLNANGQPDDLGSHGIDTYSRVLTVAITDPRQIAAARDANSTAGATTFAPGDNTNLRAISALRSTSLNFGAGNFTQTGTFEEIYNQAVSVVGDYSRRARANLELAEDRLATAVNQRDEVSAVSLDEEFTNLIRQQKAFEASARLIRVYDEIFSQLVSLI